MKQEKDIFFKGIYEKNHLEIREVKYVVIEIN